MSDAMDQLWVTCKEHGLEDPKIGFRERPVDKQMEVYFECGEWRESRSVTQPFERALTTTDLQSARDSLALYLIDTIPAVEGHAQRHGDPPAPVPAPADVGRTVKLDDVLDFVRSWGAGELAGPHTQMVANAFAQAIEDEFRVRGNA